jgi:hypothetical protein
MAFCPKCRFEYLPAVRHCPDCGSALVAELPPEEPTRDLGDVVLCTVGGEVEAALLRGRLSAHGIPSRAQVSGDIPFMGGAATNPSAQPVTIFVRREDLDRARAIYRAIEDRER